MLKGSPRDRLVVPEKAFFIWEQRKLLQMAATRYGRDLLCITDVGEAPTLILPHMVQWKQSEHTRLSEFRTHSKYSKVIRHRWKEYREYADWLERQEWRRYQEAHFARLGYYAIGGATDSEFFPDPDVEVNSSDGEAEQTGSNVTFTTLVGGAGNGADDVSAIAETQIGADTTTDRYMRLRRLLYGFLTSAIGSDTISVADFSYEPNDLRDNLSVGANENSKQVIVEASPASATAVVAGDFDSLLGITFGESLIQNSQSTGSYEVVTFNADGRAGINKSGVTNLGQQYKFDFLDDLTGLTWASAAECRVQVRMAETPTEVSDPRLRVTHVAVGGLSIPVAMHAYRQRHQSVV